MSFRYPGLADLKHRSTAHNRRAGDTVLLRPNQSDDVVVLATDRPVIASRGAVMVGAAECPCGCPGMPDDQPARISLC
ncbi:hypothetical protein NCC78_00785 [Micromonospora phytophila]|uniref:hypothetical protein n=1 Tax=Micromonospora phytophila TaxID=709888 RepID=UPI00203069A5|nr:hypothetical protein [Micromonospora phytophila]MCM0673272.1 hypothetical protein [Micromonospora phytophila]